MKHSSFAHALPWWTTFQYEKEAGGHPLLAMVDGTVVCGLRIFGPDLYDGDDEDLNLNAHLLKQVINALGENAFLQCIWENSVLNFTQEINDFESRMKASTYVG